MPEAQIGMPMGRLLQGRFLLVGFLPPFAAVFFVWLLLLAGAPGRAPHGTDALRRVSELTLGDFFLLVTVVTFVAVVLAPLQLATVRLLEGTGWPGWLARPALRRQQRRYARQLAVLRSAEERLNRVFTESARTGESMAAASQQGVLRRADEAEETLRRRFPHGAHHLRPTGLGNILAAMESEAGRPYGLDAATAWPRLYPVLGDQVRAVVDDRRDLLDAGARTCVCFTLASLVTLGLLIPHGGLTALLALAPAAVAWLSYTGAQHSAMAYARGVHVAFELHRFDLYTALRLPLPDDRQEERDMNERLCLEWRQGVPLDENRGPNERLAQYHHPGRQSIDAETLGLVGEQVRRALVPPAPVSFTGVLGAGIVGAAAEPEPDGTPQWRLTAGTTHTLRTVVATGRMAHRDPAEAEGRLPAGSAVRTVAVTGGRRATEVDLDMEIDAAFLQVAEPGHSFRCRTDSDLVVYETELAPETAGEYDLRVALYSAGRLVQAVIATVRAVDPDTAQDAGPDLAKDPR
ncbi:hypothetical protein ACFWZ6_14080 [Streptomyces massasporeus]